MYVHLLFKHMTEVIKHSSLHFSWYIWSIWSMVYGIYGLYVYGIYSLYVYGIYRWHKSEIKIEK